MRDRLLTKISALLLLLLLYAATVLADDAVAADDTLLMLIGETEPVTTVASRQAESPVLAPAMVTLVEREQIQRRGYRTLAELLADQPGFFIAAGGRGSMPYVRGLRDAVLFLYDGVPITTDVTKSFAPLDQEFSLAALERVEIMTGPGSILWGVDAFAAVVNLVPLRAAAVGVGLNGGSLHRKGAELNWGRAGESVDFHLYASALNERFHHDDYYLNDEHYGRVADSCFHELVGTLEYGDWLHLSGRWSDFERNFTMTDAATGLVWDGSKETPFNYIRLATTANQGANHFSFNGFLKETEYLLRDADIERRQKNRSTHLELLWDRRVWRRGLVTAGASWRHNQVRGALVKDRFQPDFWQPDQPSFMQTIEQADFSNDLYATFGQFRYRLGKSELWFGGRLENHSDYTDALSIGLGVRTEPRDGLHLKATYGSAFRTPYSRQLVDADGLRQEKIRTLSARLSWQPDDDRLYALTLFHSKLSHHRSEDPYGGLSLEDEREMFGAEFEFVRPLSPWLTLSGSLSWMDAGSGSEDYNILAYSIIRPDDGGREDFYESWSQPYDTGPEWLARLSLDWSIAPDSNLRLSISGGGDLVAGYAKGTIIDHYSTPTLVSLTYHRPGFFSGRDHLTLRATNLLDQDYQLPDVYGPVDGRPLTLSLEWRIDW